jgi:hypothetical protein
MKRKKPMSKRSYVRGAPIQLNYVPLNDGKSLNRFLNGF